MNLRLVYNSPTTPPGAISDPDEAAYVLGASGAGASVEIGDGYSLPLTGATGLAELREQVGRLLEVLRSGQPDYGEERLRAELPDVPPSAVLHSWLFSSYMVEMPVIVFAIDGTVTGVYTRTRAETEGWPLVVADDRDLADLVVVRTAELIDEAQAFIDRVDRDAAALTPRR